MARLVQKAAHDGGLLLAAVLVCQSPELITIPVSASQIPSAATVPELTFKAQVKPILSQYCYGCHGEQKQKGGLNLERFSDEAGVKADRKPWAELMRKLTAREMPPEGKPQPTDMERQQVVNWVRSEVFPVDCTHPDPGRVTIRRLNRAEYSNTIRDLLGVNFQAAEDFPTDDTGYGFDNIGDVLTLSPLLLEKYLAAAQNILDKAILDPESITLPKKTFSAAQFKSKGAGRLAESCCFCLYSAGEAFVNFEAKTEGDYEVRILAYGEQAGPEPARMGLRVDDGEQRTFEVKEVEAAPGWHSARVKLGAGKHRISAAFLNDYYNEKDPDPANRDRNLFIQSIEIAGPADAEVTLPASHKQILFVTPEAGHTNDAARKILTRFVERAYRRPVNAGEVERLVKFAERVRHHGASFERSIKVALQAVLVSPHFLFRGEVQAVPGNGQEPREIDEYALASRLSYFLWSSMPDDELFGLASKGQLRQHLQGQVLRMLADPKADALVDNFGGQWLQTRSLQEMAPDASVYPAFNSELRQAMAEETRHFCEYIFREDRNILEFLTADYTFLNERLAKFYGIDGVSGPEFRRVSVKGTARGGVLTQASILTLTSNPTRTSPVKRGKWVLENLLAQAPPPPPPGVPPLKEAKDDGGKATMRQRMERHRADPMCASCHSVMDPIGFGMENFDGIGAWREKEGELAVDSSGKLNTGQSFNGPAELRQILATAKREQFVHCVVEKILTYALGRGLEYYDKCATDRIAAELARKDYRFSALVLAIVRSVPFQMQRATDRENEKGG